MLLRHRKTNQVPGTADIINLPHHHHQLTRSNSSSRSLLLVVVGVAVVAVAAPGWVDGGDGHLYVAVVLVVVVKFYLVKCWHLVKRICADAHRLTVNAINLDKS